MEKDEYLRWSVEELQARSKEKREHAEKLLNQIDELLLKVRDTLEKMK